MVCTRATLAPTDGAPVQITINGTSRGQTAGRRSPTRRPSAQTRPTRNWKTTPRRFSQLIGPAADLTITKKAYLSNGETRSITPCVGETFIYALLVTNNGPTKRRAPS